MELRIALGQDKATAVMALDLEGAFDRVWHVALFSKPPGAGVDGVLLRLLRDYLQDRFMRATINGQKSGMHPIQTGDLQGSCLSPLL